MKVEEIWRYPVKSVGGERLTSATLGVQGIPGDRRWAVRDDADGEVTWAGTYPALMRASAMLRDDGTHPARAALTDSGAPRLTFPDGSGSLSEMVGVPLSLVEHPPHGSDTVIHLLSTASLRSLAAALPEVTIEPQRFRPGILIDSDAEGFPEHEWIGKRVRVGAALLRVTIGCVRCVMINQATLNVGYDKRVLEWVARNLRNVFGVYAAVETPGVIAIGDAVSVVD